MRSSSTYAVVGIFPTAVSAASYYRRGTDMQSSSFKPVGSYRMLLVAGAFLMPLCHGAWSAEPARKIVLIGGPASVGAAIGEHDFPDGIKLLKQFLDASPDTRGAKVVAYPDGWPTEASTLDGASTLVFYF